MNELLWFILFVSLVCQTVELRVSFIVVQCRVNIVRYYGFGWYLVRDNKYEVFDLKYLRVCVCGCVRSGAGRKAAWEGAGGERGGVYQQFQRGNACGQDPGCWAGRGAQNRDVQWRQPQQLSKKHRHWDWFGQTDDLLITVFIMRLRLGEPLYAKNVLLYHVGLISGGPKKYVPS